jgi:hypothetical protein
MPAKSTSTPSNAERCQHRTAAGRQCRSLADDASSGFCPHHAAQNSVELDFRGELTRNAFDFQRSQGVNNSLGVLYKLLAEGRISPRRASVLAYISSLLLRTLPAIDYDNEHFNYDDDDDKAKRSDAEEADDDEEAQEESLDEADATLEPQSVPPGREPLPATATEFADAVLSRKPS